MPNPIRYNNDRQTIDSDITDLIQTWESASIASGAVTFSGSSMTLDTQGSAATDDLDTITPGNSPTGFVLFVRSTSDARVITLKHQTGNLWLGGGDVVLESPRRVIFLLYDGTNWVHIGGGSGALAVDVDEDPGEDAVCVIAARLVEYVTYIINEAADARAGGLITVIAAVTAAIRLANPTADQSLINAWAATLVSEYADDTEIGTAFSTGVYDNLQCGMYCGNSTGDGRFTGADIPVILQTLALYTGVPYTLLADLVKILGPDGLTRAVGLSILTATTADCGGDCVCDITFAWESASSNTKAGCTVLVDVVLSIGGGSLPADIDVAISAGGTATGSGSDYTLVDTTVTFLSGSVDGDVQTVEVTITGSISVGETIILSMTPDEGVVGSPATHTVTAIAGACSDAWSQVFNLGTGNDLSAWTVGGYQVASGLNVDGTSPNFEASVTRTIAVGHSTTVTELSLSVYLFNATNDLEAIVHDGNNSGDLTFTPNGTSYGGVTGLSYNHMDLTVMFYLYNQVEVSSYITRVRYAGTGINPFTGT